MSGLVDRLLRRRNRLPKFLNRAIDSIADNPTGLAGRLAARLKGRVDPRAEHPVSAPADLPTTILIAPVNYSGQGRNWAMSLEASDPSISARNMAVDVPGGFSFAADLVVPVAVYHNSTRWQRDQLDAVVAGFTHVLVEAEEPLFGRLFDRDVSREIAALGEAGVSVAFLCHGTDVRLPSRHRASSQWSPYLDPNLYIERLERIAHRNIALVERSGRPVFVSTPDLLLDVPSATWCPVVVDPEAWALPPVDRPGPLRVVHVPSSTIMKGTALIEPTLALLQKEEVIDYRAVSGVPSDQMSAVYEWADVVLDQFRLGSYGVAACEAMAAGRLVVGHVDAPVRDAVRLATGLDLPIVEADPDTLGRVLREIAADRGALTAARVAGLKFVAHVHDGTMSANILRSHWIDLPARTGPDMRVVIATRIYAPEPSAASFMLEAVAQAFHEAGHDVTVLTTRPQRGAVIDDAPGIVVKRARVLRDSSGYVRGYLPYLSFDLPLLFRIILRRRADLYFVEPPPTTGAVVRVASALKGRPYFYDAADIWSDAAKLATSSALVLRVLRVVEIFAMRGARQAFTISQGVADRMRALGIRTPTTVIGFGVDSSAFRYEPVDDGRYFVYAGTFSEWHGADILIDAFASFSAGHPGHRLLFIGNGTDRKLIERKRDEFGLKTVELLDPMDAHSLNLVLTRATASLATLKPGQGYDYAFTTKVYSSIASGCPVLFAGVGPTAPFLAEANLNHSAGVAVEYDVEAIAAAMAAFADDPVPAERRRDLSDWARGSFSLRAVAENVVRNAERSVSER